VQNKTKQVKNQNKTKDKHVLNQKLTKKTKTNSQSKLYTTKMKKKHTCIKNEICMKRNKTKETLAKRKCT